MRSLDDLTVLVLTFLVWMALVGWLVAVGAVAYILLQLA